MIGTVGSGKSSLLAAITAEMTKEAGHICVTDLTGGFGLVSQESWIQHATVRENILFGNTFNFRFYNKVVQACALEEDFKVNLIPYCSIIMKSLFLKIIKTCLDNLVEIRNKKRYFQVEIEEN